jgi:ubiquinone/menaquinone biosynthesis C-methylase UbiE
MAAPDESEQHSARVRRAFTEQAAAFEDRRVNRVFSTDSEWLFRRLPRNDGDLVLDVAAGTGHAARQLAPTVRAVVALDATPAMLAQGRAAAEADGIGNVVFCAGDAAALPFLDDSFDIVVCRFAVHHFERPSEQVSEMCRCLRRGGRLAVADLIADTDPEVAEVQNDLERRRDPSHTRMLSAGELSELISAGGADAVYVETRSLERPLGPWLEQAKTPGAVGQEVARRLRAELDGGPVTGFAPTVVDGELWFRQTFGSCLATKPTA